MTCPHCGHKTWYEDIQYLKSGVDIHNIYCGKCDKLIKHYEKLAKPIPNKG